MLTPSNVGYALCLKDTVYGFINELLTVMKMFLCITYTVYKYKEPFSILKILLVLFALPWPFDVIPT